MLKQFLPLQHRYMAWENLPGSAASLTIAELAQAEAKPLLVICHDSLDAQRYYHELQFFLGNNTPLPLLYFPDRETLPYDQFSPHPDLISERIRCLYHLPTLTQGIVITTVSTLMHQLPPVAYIMANTFALKKGQAFQFNQLQQQLIQIGYRHVGQVMAHGEFAVRGGIIDIFPMGSDEPIRIELFDDEVESIRSFDPETQLSNEPFDEISLMPVHEFPFDKNAISLFRQQWRERFQANPNLCSVYQDVSNGVIPAGIEYYLPLFFNETTDLFHYLNADCRVVSFPKLHDHAQKFWQETQHRYEQLSHDITRPILPLNNLFIVPDEIAHRMKTLTRIEIREETLSEKANHLQFHYAALPQVQSDPKAVAPLHPLMEALPQLPPRILFCAESPGRREVLHTLLQQAHLHVAHCVSWQEFLASDMPYAITVAEIDRGFISHDSAIAVITEAQLFGYQTLQRRRRKARAFDTDAIVKNLSELHLDSPVVHLDHGVGRYRGLQTLTVGGQIGEYLTLEYAGGDKIYVPVTSLHLINRYSGMDPDHAPLNRLGTEQWEKAKQKAAEKAHDVAVELLEIHANRAARQGFKFDLDQNAYQQFARAFPFEETIDQAQAIEQVLNDMCSTKTMDRLVCGDVGFGKTEVAMRAAFIAAHSGKQVALLAPTTLLAQQHYQTFSDRFADFPIKIGLLSRFRTQKETNQVLDELTDGKVDIVIGTHKLLNSKVNFKSLGLLIIDEEHRFGVRQKEKLKSLRAEVDILTLTATPIPRTLNMALSTIRDLSIIATPPARRLSIKTFVSEYNASLIRDAVMREMMRGGQIYYVHNKVHNIQAIAEELQHVVPEARIAIAHGQMHERELERVMSDFYHHRFNILVCTTIIENGIDIPSANTIIINRADQFGLAQLHQLRGRVGRSHHQAYAYLIVPEAQAMTADAQKRLEAIASLEDLGVGFTLAMHDLEIRGAGELLGDEQSGNIQTVGFGLYSELLDRAVKAIKEGKIISLEETLNQQTEINLQMTALFPENYVPDVHARLILYKRIASIKNLDEMHDLQIEIIDRFGLMPEPVKHLFAITELRLLAEQIGIKKIEAHGLGGRFEFLAKPHIDAIKIIQLIQRASQIFKFDGPERVKFTQKMEKPGERIEFVKKILNELLK